MQIAVSALQFVHILLFNSGSSSRFTHNSTVFSIDLTARQMFDVIGSESLTHFGRTSVIVPSSRSDKTHTLRYVLNVHLSHCLVCG